MNFWKYPCYLYCTFYLSFGFLEKTTGQRPMCYITLNKLLEGNSCIEISNTCHAYFPKESKQGSFTWTFFYHRKGDWTMTPYQILSHFLTPSTNSPHVYNFTWNFSWAIKSNSLTQTFQIKVKISNLSCASQTLNRNPFRTLLSWLLSLKLFWDYL